MTEVYKLARPLMAGVKCSIGGGQVMEQDVIKNRMVREMLGGLPQFVGEIVCGSPTADDCFQRTLEFLNNPYAIELWIFWVYDLRTTEPYDLRARLDICEPFVVSCGPNVQYVDHDLLESQNAVDEYLEKVTGRGFKGIVLRQPFGTFGHEDEIIKAEDAKPDNAMHGAESEASSQNN